MHPLPILEDKHNLAPCGSVLGVIYPALGRESLYGKSVHGMPGQFWWPPCRSKDEHELGKA